jgi:hypothetical protein
MKTESLKQNSEISEDWGSLCAHVLALVFLFSLQRTPLSSGFDARHPRPLTTAPAEYALLPAIYVTPLSCVTPPSEGLLPLHAESELIACLLHI